ncbi:DUF4105 domain-containing protein [bacterium]|nr:DUF4105 domain-containing protein [bacterium]
MKFFHLILFFLVVSVSSCIDQNVYDDFYQQLKARSNFDIYEKEYESKRSFQRFTNSIDQNKNLYLIDNIRTMGENPETAIGQPNWKSVVVDVNKVNKVYWMMNEFVIKAGPIKYTAGHAQMLFEFESGGAVTKDGELNGLVNSYEAFIDKGMGYDPIIKGMNGTYDSVITLSSKDYAVRASASRDTKIVLYELNLSKSEKIKLLKVSLSEAFDRKKIEASQYHTTRNSCVTNQFRILNLFLPKKKRLKEWNRFFGIKISRTMATVVPRKVGYTLKKSGLVISEQSYNCPDEAINYINQNHRQLLYQKLYN